MGKAPASFAPGKLPAVPLVIPPSLPGLGHSSPVRLWLQREDGWSLETRLCVCFLWLLVSFSFLGVFVVAIGSDCSPPLRQSRCRSRFASNTVYREKKSKEEQCYG